MMIIIIILLTVYVGEYQHQQNELLKHEKVLVEGGTFEMGFCTEFDKDSLFHYLYNEKNIKRHDVTLSSFYISKFEVTNEQYVYFLNSVKNSKKYLSKHNYRPYIEFTSGKFSILEGFEKNPVTQATWYGAVEYCKWVGGRLPTEAEWEYAARGGKKSQNYLFSGSNNLEEVAVSLKGLYSVNHTKKVGSKKPNELGIYDMSGNASEWCYDWYIKDYYAISPVLNPKGPEKGERKVSRGGSYVHGSPYATFLTFFRTYPSPMGGDGFRVCFELD